MIRSRHYTADFRVVRRTYTLEEWSDEETRMSIIHDARDTARQIAPGKVLIYVREKPRRKGALMVTVVAR